MVSRGLGDKPYWCNKRRATPQSETSVCKKGCKHSVKSEFRAQDRGEQ
jgi:hypothetical protein